MRVYIVRQSPAFDREYDAMFVRKGWTVTMDIKQADLLQFTGGEDVSPELYGEVLHSHTHCNPVRDKRERLIFTLGVQRNVPMAGICRGGQFLNVMCGGEMWQHVDNHGVAKGHEAIDELSGEIITVSSTHHQLMRPNKEAVTLMTARETTWKERVTKSGHYYRYNMKKQEDDIEVVAYPDFRTLCFQPHPEFPGFPECTDWYFKYMEGVLFSK